MHKNMPHVRNPECVMNGTSLSAFVMKNAATAAVPTKSHVENVSIGSLALKHASNIEDTIAFSAFRRARRFHSWSDSVLGSSGISNLMNSVYLSRDQAETNQERLLRQINIVGVDHARWLRIRRMKASARYMSQIMAYIEPPWATHAHMVTVAHDRQEYWINLMRSITMHLVADCEYFHWAIGRFNA
jgi:hypothetical protein